MRYIAAAFVLSLSTPALAEDVSEEDRCAFVNTFEGPGSTTLTFSQTQKQFDNGDNVLVLVQNDIWSLKEGDEVGEVKFDGPDAWFSTEALAMTNGFGLLMDWKLFYDVFNEVSGGLAIIRKGKTIDQLSLLATYTDVLALSRCHDKRVVEKAERERKAEIDRKWSADPFAE